MAFYSMAGHMALGSRLRRLADQVTQDAEHIYELYKTGLDPRWFPVFYMLTQKEEAGITELAEDIGQSHAAVSQVVRDMIKAGLVETHKSSKDARVNKAVLTPKARDLVPNFLLQCKDVRNAVGSAFDDSGSNLWAEIEALENELERKSLYKRVHDIRKKREGESVEIVSFSANYRQAYKELNEAWITQYWDMEASDHKALDAPEESIIEKGGYIAIAIKDKKAVGTCALIKMNNDCYELAKMAVAEPIRGLGVGYLLGQHCIEKAAEMGSSRIYLESNTKLRSAINLYRKLGFKRLPLKESPYARCNIQMELILQ